MKAARDKRNHDGSGKYIDKYLQKFCLHWWNAFTNHAGRGCGCRTEFQGPIHSIAKGFVSLCHYENGGKKSYLNNSTDLSLISVCCMLCGEGYSSFEYPIGYPCCLFCRCKNRILSLSFLYTKLEENQLSDTERQLLAAGEDVLHHENKGTTKITIRPKGNISNTISM